MSTLELFQSAEWSVRVVDVNGEPWFVSRDVCDALDISAHRDAMARLDADERGSVTVDTLGGPQDLGAINEAGLYSLVLRSQKPAAKAFKRWVTHEVLPQIRRTGSYAPAPVEFTELEVAQRWVKALEEKAVVEAQLAEAERSLAIAAPKVEAFDEFLAADGSLSMDQVAKALGIGRNTLYRQLREIGVIQQNTTLPMQKHAHHFDVVIGVHTRNDAVVPHHTTRVKPSGIEMIYRKLGERNGRQVALQLINGGAA